MSSINTKCIDILETIYTMGKLRHMQEYGQSPTTRKNNVFQLFNVAHLLSQLSMQKVLLVTINNLGNECIINQ